MPIRTPPQKERDAVSECLHTIGFIGAGNMAAAMIGAVIRAGLFEPACIHASDVDPEKRRRMHAAHGILTTGDNARVFDACDIVVLAVKPQMMAEALAPVVERLEKTDFDRKLVISIAAGVPLERLEEWLYPAMAESMRGRMPIVRVMPNTPALVLAGMSAMSPNRHAAAEDLEITRRILKAMGQVRELPESDLDGVTALSGSGPAYVFYFIESMVRAGEALGFDRDTAAALTRATFEGALRLLAETGETPADLRRKVTSPGGTTEAALRVLEEKQVGRHIVDAVAAAARRSKELSG
jgi:pyrroline-5-carboxylate reductase